MDTKLKNFSQNSWTKAFFCGLLILGFVLAACTAVFISVYSVDFEPLFEQDYIASSNHLKMVGDLIYEMTDTIQGVKTMDENPASIIYFCTDGNKIYTNTSNYQEAYFKSFETYYIVNGGIYQASQKSNPDVGDSYSLRYFLENSNAKAYLAFTDSYLGTLQNEQTLLYQQAMRQVVRFVGGLFLALVSFIYLVAVAGRKKGDGKLYLQLIDHIYTDVLFCAGVLIVILWCNFMLQMGQQTYQNGFELYVMVGMVAAVSLTASAAMLGILLSFARQVKDRSLVTFSFTYVCFAAGYHFIQSFFDGRRFQKYPFIKSVFKRQMAFMIGEITVIFCAALCVGSYNFGLFFIFILAGCLILYWYLKANYKDFGDMGKLLDQISQISEGQLLSKTDIGEDSLLRQSSNRLAVIGGGMQKSMEKQIKDERMKIDLVTNVSHDLKTPLTSIISYVDLLSKDESLSNEARDYVHILSQKSNRLKNIVADLFDLARTTSGNAELMMERLDLKKLIEQTLGDMGDRLEVATQTVKIDLPQTPVYIDGDGKKLYRVFQNIIDNALKYSLDGTRIFVDIYEKDGRAWSTVKNTASYEMNFTTEEILERFSRGDKSRTMEGSGLGLSIADSFTTACGGHFEIMIDGDQFKTTVSFPLGEDPKDIKI